MYARLTNVSGGRKESAMADHREQAIKKVAEETEFSEEFIDMALGSKTRGVTAAIRCAVDAHEKLLEVAELNDSGVLTSRKLREILERGK